MTRIVVIADDFSGAAEIAGIAFSHGLSAEVQRRFEPGSHAEVVAIDTDSRGMDAPSARTRVLEVARQVAASRPDWIYKKVDSVLRGHPRDEIEAVLEATGLSRAVLIPANPSRGRVIVSGRYLINGVPLDQTEFARDPEYSSGSAFVGALLGKGESLDLGRVVVPDVGDLEQLRQQVRQVSSVMLAAGAADFFAELLETRYPNQRVVTTHARSHSFHPAILVCGSQAAWTVRRPECDAARLPVAIWSEQSGEEWLELCCVQLQSAKVLVLGVGKLSSIVAEQRDYLHCFAAAVTKIIDLSKPATLLAEGGATAAAIVQQAGWTRFAVAEQSPAGVGSLQPLDAGGAPRLLIKPGSYPWPAGIWDDFTQATDHNVAESQIEATGEVGR